MQNTFRETGLRSPNSTVHLSHGDTLAAPEAGYHIIIYDAIFAVDNSAGSWLYTQLKETDSSGSVILNLTQGAINFTSPEKVAEATAVHRHGSSTGGWVTLTYRIEKS